MVVNEKILLKLMARDWKNEQYTVGVYTKDGEQKLFLHGTEWETEITWQVVPDKVLALIVQHMRKLPEDGQAFTISKDEEPTSVGIGWYSMNEPRKDTEYPEIRRTPILYDGFSVWQKPKNDGCHFFGGLAADLMDDHGRRVRYLDGGMYLEGTNSRVFIYNREFMADTPHTRARAALSEEKWV